MFGLQLIKLDTKSNRIGLFLFSQEALNLTVPDWMNDDVMTTLSNGIAQLMYTKSFGGKEGPLKRRLLAGKYVK